MKITHKLILFISFSLISIISIIIISLLNTNILETKDNFNQIESLLSKASKDYSIFLKNKNIGLIERYNSNLESAKNIVNLNNSDKFNKIIHLKIDTLLNYTNKTFEYWKMRGLDEDNGYEGEFRRNVHNLEYLLEKENLSLLTISMLQIRRSEKDFIVRRKPEYVGKVLNMISTLEKQTKKLDKNVLKKDSILQLSNQYKITFINLVDILDTIDIRNRNMFTLETDLNKLISKNINNLEKKYVKFSNLMYVSFVLFFVSLLFISFVMYRRILNPISALKMKTTNISNGNYNDLVTYENRDEIGEFANSFNKMVNKFLVTQDKLELLNNELDKKVRERTELLQKEVEMRKKSEQKLEKYNTEVKLLLEKEQQLSKLKTKFVATVSHEYRTPLTVIQNSTYLIYQFALKQDIDSVNNYLNKIQFSVVQMKDLLEDTLNYGEIENGKHKLTKSRFNLDILIRDLIQDFVTINKEREIKYLNNSNLDYIFTDKKAIHHCLNNIIANAIKFSKDIIFIKLEDNEFDISISITDNGIGIPLEDQKNIFSAFYRTNLTKHINGTGLGLSIAKKYIDSLGGSISLKSEVGNGSTFILKIPYQREFVLTNSDIIN